MIDFQKLEDTAYPGAFSVYDIEILAPAIASLEPGQVYLEVGVDRGRSLSVAKMVAKEGVKLYGVDLQEDPKVAGTIFIQGDSGRIGKVFMEDTIDVLFIDGDHSYKGCKRDIAAWLPKVNIGGKVFFHDYDISSPGVIKSVNEFAKAHPGYTFIPSTNKRSSIAFIQL